MAASNAALSLTNSLVSRDMLLESPSFKDGVPPVLEGDLRIWGCQLIQLLGLHLKLPQVSMSTGQVLFQRFFYRRSMVKFGVEDVATACIYLAAKLEESPRRAREVINVAHYLRSKHENQKYEPMDIICQKHEDMKADLVRTEKHILKNLGFNVHVQHPHKLIINFFKLLNVGEGDPLVQKAWNYMNDSCRTNVFVRYQPYVVASAVIMLASRSLNRPLPMNPPWWTFFESTLPEMEDICRNILYLYTRDISGDLPITVQQMATYLRNMNGGVLPSPVKLTATPSPDRADPPPNEPATQIQNETPPIEPPAVTTTTTEAASSAQPQVQDQQLPLQTELSRERPAIREADDKHSRKTTDAAEQQRKSHDRERSRSEKSRSRSAERTHRRDNDRDQRDRDRDRDRDRYHDRSSRPRSPSSHDAKRDRDRSSREKDRERDHERSREKSKVVDLRDQLSRQLPSSSSFSRNRRSRSSSPKRSSIKDGSHSPPRSRSPSDERTPSPSSNLRTPSPTID